MSTLDAVAADAHAAPPRRRRVVRRVLVALVVLALLAAGGIVAAREWPSRSDDGGATDGSSARVTTAAVARRTLTARTSVDGTLGYAGDHTVGGRIPGTVTWLPGLGRVIRDGEVLYKVDGTPVILLYGATPAWRELAEGKDADDVTGVDVRQLNRALVRLGYADGLGLDPGSDEFGWATKAAVKRLQDDLGVDDTGKLALGAVVFLPAALRVTKHLAALGAAASGPILEATSTRRVVTVSLAAAQQSQLKPGDRVGITLPDNTTTPGRVTSVSRVATRGSSGSAKFSVTIRPTTPKDTGRLDQAPVQVDITTATARNALVVPVTALLALAGGGYAVETEGAEGARTLVAVTLGLFDDSQGLVQVTGHLAVGERVTVPST